MFTRICRTVAAAAACLLAAVGAVVLAVVSPFALVGVLVTGLLVGMIVATHLPGAVAPEVPALARDRRRRAHRIGAAVAAATAATLLAMAGSAALLGAAAAPVFLVLLLGGAAGLWRHRGAWRTYVTDVGRTGTPPRPAGRARPVAAAAPQVAPATLTVRALCLAWQRSQWSLSSLPFGPTRSELLSTRERLLDELERRDPVGFHHWLHRSVRATSDPGHYLTENRSTPTPTGSPRRIDDDGRTP